MCFVVVMLFLGFLLTAIYNQLVSSSDERFHVSLGVYLTFYIFFSFFGTFYINAVCWEVLVYSSIIPRLFEIRVPETSKARTSLHRGALGGDRA